MAEKLEWIDEKYLSKFEYLEIDSEIKMLDEKIEDARGDVNRQAKYALMRTRSELIRARDKIKYNLTATKDDIKTAKSYLSRRDRDNM